MDEVWVSLVIRPTNRHLRDRFAGRLEPGRGDQPIDGARATVGAADGARPTRILWSL